MEGTHLTGDTDEHPPTGELGVFGRLAIGVVVLAGLVVAVPSGIGLLWYIPYAGVAAILVIRRPRTSIGWLLLGLGWVLALSNYRLDATVAQLASGSVPFPTNVLAFALSASAGAIFVLFAILATVFPSGRLPDGRWGRIARGLLVLAALSQALGAFAPNINVNIPGYTNGAIVPNPFAVLPGLPVWQWLTSETLFEVLLLVLVITSVAFVVRARRSEGVERLQLRWVGAAFGFSVVALLGGLSIGGLVPATMDNGLALLPALIAFATVPVAIGIAVLRYRLYDIDTIINRAIVYGLLTAILAGGSAAAIALIQRLFQGVIGPGSDATIVLTTLIIVAAFNPVKTRLQTLVDRRFKEVHSPTALLDSFVTEVHRSISTPDTDRTVQRLLEVAARAYRASGGEVRVETQGGDTRSFQLGTVTAESGLRASASSGPVRVEILLSGGDQSREAAALQPALASVLSDTTAAD